MADPKEPRVEICGICNVPYKDHDREQCEVCGSAIVHHTPEQTEAEWEGRARMAASKRAAGGRLTPLEAKALAKYPNPPFLNGDTLTYTQRTA